ncbi:O-antigen ligase family protein [Patescibacteria group bacterium]|nr:O-antigen ligase family protein [Patescibacteria group bacterium]
MNFIKKLINPPIEPFVFKIYIYWVLITITAFLFFSQNISNTSNILILSILSFGFFILRFLRGDIKFPSKFGYIFLAFIIFCIISLFFTINFYTSILYFLYYLSGFFILILSFDILSDIKTVRWFFGILLFIASVFTLYSIYNYIIGYDVRLTGTLLSPDIAAGFLLFIIPISLYFTIAYKSTFSRLMSIFLSILFITALYITFSRGAYISFLIEMIIMLIVLYKYFFKKKLQYIILILITILFSFSLSLLHSSVSNRISLSHISSVTSGTVQSLSVNDRLDVYEKSIELTFVKPIFGFGIGTFGEVFLKYQNRPWVYFKYTHNQYLEMFVEGGIIGGGIFLLFFSYLFLKGIIDIYRKRGDKYRERVPKYLLYIFVFASLSGTMSHSMIDYDWYSITIFFLLMVFIGIYLNNFKDLGFILKKYISFSLLIISFVMILLSLDFFYAENLMSVGIAQYNKGNLIEAKYQFKNSLKFNPYNSLPYVWLASIYKDNRLYKKSLSNLSYAKSIDPYNADILYRIGSIYTYEGKNMEALKYYSKAYNFNHYSNPKYVLSLAETYGMLKNTKEAIKLYKLAIHKYFPLNNTYKSYQEFYKLNGFDLNLGYIYTNLYILTHNIKYKKEASKLVIPIKTFVIKKK